MNDEPSDADRAEPTTEQIVAILFQAAMSGSDADWARINGVDPKLLEMWKFTHAREYITYLEKLLRLVKSRANTAD
jgi:hypothetical protein